jgi:uncharacterized delta-60 repeat protein
MRLAHARVLLLGTLCLPFTFSSAVEDDALDAGFGSIAGRATASFDLGGNLTDVATRVLRRSDGRYVLVGTATTASGVAVAIARFDSGGLLDPSFGSGGKLHLDLCMSEVTDAALDGSGRILILGNTTACGTAGSEDGRLARLTAAGALDASFSGGGVRNITFTTVTAAQERAYALVLRANGEILVGGSVDNDGSGPTHIEHPAFRRLDADGNDLTNHPGVTYSVAARIVAGRSLADGGVVWAVDRDQTLSGGTAVFWRLTAALTNDTAFGSLGLQDVQSGGGETGCGTGIDHRPISLLSLRGTFKMFGGAEVGGIWRAWFASVDDAAGGPNRRVRCLTASLPSGVYGTGAAFHGGFDGNRVMLAATCGSALAPRFCVLGLRLSNAANPDLLEIDPAFNGGLPLTIDFPHHTSSPGPAGGAIGILREAGGRTVIGGWRRWQNLDFDFAVARLGRGLFKDGFETSD